MSMMLEYYKITPLTLSIIEGSSTQQEAVLKVIEWISKNFRHYHTETYNPISYRDNVIPSFEEFFRYRTAGCHRHSQILVAMLRSVNIPAIEFHLKGHGVTYIPNLDMFMHGDLGLKYPALQNYDSLLMDRNTFLNYAQQDPDGEFGLMELEIHNQYAPLSKVGLFRTNDYNFYLSSPNCVFSEDFVQNQATSLRNLLPEYQISFVEDTENCFLPYTSDTYEIRSNQIPVKTFSQLLDEALD